MTCALKKEYCSSCNPDDNREKSGNNCVCTAGNTENDDGTCGSVLECPLTCETCNKEVCITCDEKLNRKLSN